MDFRERDLAGIAGPRAAGALLLERRSEDLSAGLTEAGDIDWWWAAGEGDDFRTTLWADVAGRDVACLMVVRSATSAGGWGQIDADVGWLPSADVALRADVVPEIVARRTGRTSISASARTGVRSRRTASAGWMPGTASASSSRYGRRMPTSGAASAGR